jgi:hypothetical protein
MIRLLLLVFVLAARTATAESFEARFDLTLRGLVLGQVALAAEESGGRYAVTGAAGATGLARRIARYSYEGRARGRITGGRTSPDRYVEVEIGRGERSETVTEWAGGRIASSVTVPPPEPEPWDIDPRGLAGLTDPLSALYAMLRPMAPAAACGVTHDLFDGRRRSRLILSVPTMRDGRLTCAARYERIAGYPAEELAERDGTIFDLFFERLPDGRVQVAEMRGATSLGTAVLRRR